MAEYTLYCFAQSGNAYKPALMLNLAGADLPPNAQTDARGRVLNVMDSTGRGVNPRTRPRR